MNKCIILLLTVGILTSCNFTEEITFNADGSGEVVMGYDMSVLMKTIEKEFGGNPNKETKEKEKLDSTFYFKDLLSEKVDSIAALPKEEQERLQSLEKVFMKIKIDEAEGIMDFGFGSRFTSLEELHETFENLTEAKEINSEKDPLNSKLSESQFTRLTESILESVDFQYNGKQFSRLLKEGMAPTEEDIEALNKEMEEAGEMKDFNKLFAGMTYTLKYSFPKAIQSVGNEKAVILEDGKTVILKANFMDMIKNPKLMDLQVTLED